MNTKNILLPAVLFLAALSSGQGSNEVALAKCPDAVQETIRQHLDGGVLDDVKTITTEGRTLYVADIARKTGDDDRKVYVAGDGKLLKTCDEIAFKDAPAAVQAAATKLAGGGKVDDVIKEAAEGKITYHVEIDHLDKKDKDIKAVFNEDGTIVSQRKD